MSVPHFWLYWIWYCTYQHCYNTESDFCQKSIHTDFYLLIKVLCIQGAVYCFLLQWIICDKISFHLGSLCCSQDFTFLLFDVKSYVMKNLSSLFPCASLMLLDWLPIHHDLARLQSCFLSKSSAVHTVTTIVLAVHYLDNYANVDVMSLTFASCLPFIIFRSQLLSLPLPPFLLNNLASYWYANKSYCTSES